MSRQNIILTLQACWQLRKNRELLLTPIQSGSSNIQTTASIIGEVNSQFDKAAGYDAVTNASGTAVWILSGTTPANTVRHYYIYFDTIENPKAPPAYSTALNWNSTTHVLSNTHLAATLGPTDGTRSGISSLKYDSVQYLS